MTDLEVREQTLNRDRSCGSVGRREPRKEDDRLLRGAGRYTGDVGRARIAEMAVGRCPFPHARINSIDPSAALRLPGVYEVLTGAEVARRSGSIGLLRPDFGAPPIDAFALARDRATYEGQGVVSVVAASRHLAEDALELIEIDYEPLPHVCDVESALAPGAPIVYPELLSSNLLVTSEHGRGDVAARMAEADVVVGGHFVVNRVSGLPMETRAVIAEWQRGARQLTAWVSTQVPHVVRRQLAGLLGLPDGSVRVVASDVGGGFGLKLGVYPEDVLVCLHAMSLGRPVRWIEDRNEHFRATTHARESVHDYRIAARADGRIIAVEDVYTNDLGATNSVFGSSQQSTIVFSGPYKVEDGRVERRVVVTNKTPVGAYRGFGQPEVNFACECAIDRLARRLGIDPLELRVMNMIKRDELPWTNPVGSYYDSGDYEASLRMAAAAVDYDSHRSAGAGARRLADGRFRGVGLAAYVERTGVGAPKAEGPSGAMFGAHESVTLRANWDGGVDLYSGVSNFGQGSETVFAQICADCLGVEYSSVAVHAGDTEGTPLNTGGFASRTVIAAAGAIEQASQRLRDRILRIGGHALGTDPSELVLAGGVVTRRDGGARSVELRDIARRAILGEGLPAGEPPGLEETSYFLASHAAYAFGAAAAIVDVDATTGEFEIERVVMVHDSGTAINPTLVEGQVRGGVVQALGAALSEDLVYDADSGQLLNGTMMDYFAPLVSDVPPIELIATEFPSPVTPLGVRGAGESGTIPVAAAVANAITDALVDFGVEIDRLPITPERIWRLVQAQGQARPPAGDAGALNPMEEYDGR